MSKVVLGITTIHIPTFLNDVYQNAIDHGHSDIHTIIIGDVKTPDAIRPFCEEVSTKYGFTTEYLGIDEQKKALEDFPELFDMMPLNSGVRKMIANLLAYLQPDCETLIMVDDDNFVTDCDFVGLHSIVGNNVEMDLYRAKSGWYNVYEAVVEQNNIPFFPRGYPWSERVYGAPERSCERLSKKVVSLNGLVLEDPDIDAIARLFWPIRVTEVKTEFLPHYGLYPGTWTSFNNQNTAICREVIPAYFTPPATGRNADIWTSYVMCKLASHMDDVIAFGHPVVRQERNPHSLWRDLDDELLNNKATDDFVRILRDVPLQGQDYKTILQELIQGSLERVGNLKDVPEDECEMMRSFFGEYATWLSLFERMK